MPSQPDKTQPKASRRPGRFRGALSVLLGTSVSPMQLQAEWAEYQTMFNDLLARQSALLARNAKAEKERIKKLMAEDSPCEGGVKPPASGRSKEELRTIAANSRGLGGYVRQLQNSMPEVDA